MRTPLITITLFLLIAPTKSQTVMEPIWIKTESSNNGTTEGWGVDVDEDGAVYWAVSTNHLSQELDIKCYKFNPAGEEPNTRTGHFVVDDDYIFAAGLWNGTGLANLYNGHSFLGKFPRSDGN